MAARLKQIFNEKIVPELKQKLELKNTMQVPRILKITVNMGVGEAVADKKVMDAATADMAKITGQKRLPSINKHARATPAAGQTGVAHSPEINRKLSFDAAK